MQHYGTYDIATSGESYVLGLRHVFSEAAQDTLDMLEEELHRMHIKVSSRIVSKLKKYNV